jgi:hypothetical protein
VWLSQNETVSLVKSLSVSINLWIIASSLQSMNDLFAWPLLRCDVTYEYISDIEQTLSSDSFENLRWWCEEECTLTYNQQLLINKFVARRIDNDKFKSLLVNNFFRFFHTHIIYYHTLCIIIMYSSFIVYCWLFGKETIINV